MVERLETLWEELLAEDIHGTELSVIIREVAPLRERAAGLLFSQDPDSRIVLRTLIRYAPSHRLNAGKKLLRIEPLYSEDRWLIFRMVPDLRVDLTRHLRALAEQGYHRNSSDKRDAIVFEMINEVSKEKSTES